MLVAHLARRMLAVAVCASFALAFVRPAVAQGWPGIDFLDPPATPTPGFNQDFGGEIAVSGEWAAVGQNGKATIHMYQRTSAGWVHAQSIRGPRHSSFGFAVSIDGDTMVAGLPEWGWPNVERGRVWVFKRVGDEWVRTQTLVAPELEPGSGLGVSVAVSGDVMAAGAPHQRLTSPGPWSGAVVVFERSGQGWERKAVLPWTPCCPGVLGVEAGQMGWSIAVSGDTIVAGAPRSADGQAYVFERDVSGAWGRSAILLDPSPHLGGKFGQDVALEGDLAVIGRPRLDSGGFSYDPGSAYVFQRSSSSGSWAALQELQASDGHGGSDYGDEFGAKVALRGGRIAIAANNHNGVEPLDGKLYVFEQIGAAQWVESRQFTSPSYALETGLGRSLALSDEYVLAGIVDQFAGRKRVYAFELAVGEDYCSGGGANTLSVIGSSSHSQGALSLVARHVPPGARSVYLLGTQRAQLPMAGGQLCLGPAVYRVGPLQLATGSNQLIQLLDFQAPPLAGLAFGGATLAFQHWMEPPGAAIELSNAVGLQLVQ